MNIRLLAGESPIMEPVVSGEVKWTLERKGTPGKLTFTAVQDISIHTPRVGRDAPRAALSFLPEYFNPHAPCGA